RVSLNATTPAITAAEMGITSKIRRMSGCQCPANPKSEIPNPKCLSLVLRMNRPFGVLVRRRLVQCLEISLGAGGGDIRFRGLAVEDPIVMDDLDQHFSLSLFADSQAPHLVVLQSGKDVGDAFEGVEDRINRPVADRRVADEGLTVLLQLNRGRGN